MAIAPGHRCARYECDDRPCFQSLETRIIEGVGGRIRGPDTGRYFANRMETGEGWPSARRGKEKRTRQGTNRPSFVKDPDRRTVEP